MDGRLARLRAPRGATTACAGGRSRPAGRSRWPPRPSQCPVRAPRVRRDKSPGGTPGRPRPFRRSLRRDPEPGGMLRCTSPSGVGAVTPAPSAASLGVMGRSKLPSRPSILTPGAAGTRFPGTGRPLPHRHSRRHTACQAQVLTGAHALWNMHCQLSLLQAGAAFGVEHRHPQRHRALRAVFTAATAPCPARARRRHRPPHSPRGPNSRCGHGACRDPFQSAG